MMLVTFVVNLVFCMLVVIVNDLSAQCTWRKASCTHSVEQVVRVGGRPHQGR